MNNSLYPVYEQTKTVYARNSILFFQVDGTYQAFNDDALTVSESVYRVECEQEEVGKVFLPVVNVESSDINLVTTELAAKGYTVTQFSENGLFGSHVFSGHQKLEYKFFPSTVYYAPQIKKAGLGLFICEVVEKQGYLEGFVLNDCPRFHYFQRIDETMAIYINWVDQGDGYPKAEKYTVFVSLKTGEYVPLGNKFDAYDSIEDALVDIEKMSVDSNG